MGDTLLDLAVDRVVVTKDDDSIHLTVWDRDRRIMELRFPVAVVSVAGSDLICSTFPALAPFLKRRSVTGPIEGR